MQDVIELVGPFLESSDLKEGEVAALAENLYEASLAPGEPQRVVSDTVRVLTTGPIRMADQEAARTGEAADNSRAATAAADNPSGAPTQRKARPTSFRGLKPPNDAHAQVLCLVL